MTGNTFIVSGNGDVIEPDDNIAAIGSGADPFAKRAAVALIENTKLSARSIVEKAKWPSRARPCIYTNESVVYEELG